MSKQRYSLMKILMFSKTVKHYRSVEISVGGNIPFVFMTTVFHLGLLTGRIGKHIFRTNCMGRFPSFFFDFSFFPVAELCICFFLMRSRCRIRTKQTPNSFGPAGANRYSGIYNPSPSEMTHRFSRWKTNNRGCPGWTRNNCPFETIGPAKNRLWTNVAFLDTCFVQSPMRLCKQTKNSRYRSISKVGSLFNEMFICVCVCVYQ